VLDPDPQMIPDCKPPYGCPVWGIVYIWKGQPAYGWVCLRNIGTPVDSLPPITD
jgi:hypothetical protein